MLENIVNVYMSAYTVMTVRAVCECACVRLTSVLLCETTPYTSKSNANQRQRVLRWQVSDMAENVGLPIAHYKSEGRGCFNHQKDKKRGTKINEKGGEIRSVEPWSHRFIALDIGYC